MTPDESPIRQWLERILQRDQLAYLDRLLAALKNELENPTSVDPTALFPPDVIEVEDIRDYLEQVLNPEQMQLLNQLVSELDTGNRDLDSREEYARAAQAREGAGAGMGRQEESTQMHANDSREPDHGFRVALRNAGVPVGSQGSRANLERLWANRPGGPLAMDQRRRLPSRYAFDSMFPGLRNRYAPSSGSVFPDRERERAAASTRRMAFDSRHSADPRLSIRAVFGSEFAARLKV